MSERVSPAPKRRLFDQSGGAPTLIGSGSEFEGRVAVRGPLAVSGTIKGDGTVEGLLSIARDGHWQGEVVAESAVIAGRLDGTLEVRERLEIGRTAVIRGRVRARVVAIADGATIEGELEVTGGQPVVRFVEKRSAADAP